MPLYNHKGGSESSHDMGEKYKGRIEEYLRARGYSIERRSNHHGTTEDLAAVGIDDEFHCLNGEKVGEEFKKFIRVEAKGTDLSRLDKSFLTELARVFIDYCEQDGGFEYHVYARDLLAFDKWKRIFSPRTNSDEAIKEYFRRIVDDHKLNDEEVEAFQRYDVDDFEWFLADVFVHQADGNRLRQMAEDERSIDRSKWEFYTRENSPYHEPETFIPNFRRISEFPDYIYIGDSLANHPEDIYDTNPRYSPIWVESGTFYSLFPATEMSDSLRNFVDMESIQRREFDRWLQEDGADGIAKKLFNRFLRRRAVESYDGCKMVRHQYENRLIFAHEEPDTDGDGPHKTKVEEWDVTMERGNYVAHRYAVPQVKQYGDAFYVFVETGWMFSRSGRGINIITGDRASQLHNDLQSAGYHQSNNMKAQFRQWHSYLGLGANESGRQSRLGTEAVDDSRVMAFAEADELELRKRPPKDTDERELLMKRGVGSY